MIAIPACHRAADTLAGTAAHSWCAFFAVSGTDRPSSAVIQAGMRRFIAPQADHWPPVASRPARLLTASTDSHAIQYA
jgi:hypothetical protein